MAAFHTPRQATGLNASALPAFFANMFAAFTVWNTARVTRNALMKLTDRELDDIGLTYGDIEKVVDGKTR